MLDAMDVDPDSRARTHLANERTFLAWFRTGITLVALGIAAAELLGRGGEPGALLVRGLAGLVILAGAGSVAIGLVRYRHARRQIDAQGFFPAWTSITLTAAAGIALAAVALLVVVVLRPV
jgi:putative membrane protein